MSDKVYILKPIKVKLADYDNEFDAYQICFIDGRRAAWNDGGYEYPLFDKHEAMKVARMFNSLALIGDGDGTKYAYDSVNDVFVEDYFGEIKYIERNVYGLYPMGFDMGWVIA